MISANARVVTLTDAGGWQSAGEIVEVSLYCTCVSYVARDGTQRVDWFTTRTGLRNGSRDVWIVKQGIPT